MTRFTASTSTTDGALWLYLDNELIAKNGEEVSFELTSGQEYIVHWFVNGKPQSAYSITISSPKEAQFQLTKGLRLSGKDYGGFKFKA